MVPCVVPTVEIAQGDKARGGWIDRRPCFAFPALVEPAGALYTLFQISSGSMARLIYTDCHDSSIGIDGQKVGAELCSFSYIISQGHDFHWLSGQSVPKAGYPGKKRLPFLSRPLHCKSFRFVEKCHGKSMTVSTVRAPNVCLTYSRRIYRLYLDLLRVAFVHRILWVIPAFTLNSSARSSVVESS